MVEMSRFQTAAEAKQDQVPTRSPWTAITWDCSGDKACVAVEILGSWKRQTMEYQLKKATGTELGQPKKTAYMCFSWQTCKGSINQGCKSLSDVTNSPQMPGLKLQNLVCPDEFWFCVSKYSLLCPWTEIFTLYHCVLKAHHFSSRAHSWKIAWSIRIDLGLWNIINTVKTMGLLKLGWVYFPLWDDHEPLEVRHRVL